MTCRNAMNLAYVSVQLAALTAVARAQTKLLVHLAKLNGGDRDAIEAIIDERDQLQERIGQARIALHEEFAARDYSNAEHDVT